jgi:hypothetical protein
MVVSLNDLTKDCCDALRKARIFVSCLFREQLRLLDLFVDDGPAREYPTLMRYAGTHPGCTYACAYCGATVRPSADTLATAFHRLCILPSYVAACCADCNAALLRVPARVRVTTARSGTNGRRHPRESSHTTGAPRETPPGASGLRSPGRAA